MSLRTLLKMKKILTISVLNYTVAFISLILISSIVNGANLPAIDPFGLEAGVVGRNISNSPSPFTPNAAPSFTPKAAEPEAINPEAAKISFVLNKIILDGNHAFTTAQLQTIFAPFLHKKITVAELQKLVQSVTDQYQKGGYFLSKALLPPQEIKNGVVRVTIIEGFISSIKVQGLERDSLIKLMEKYGANIQASKPIKLADLERYLLLMNDIPGFNVKSVLAPDAKVPLGSTLTLVTEQIPFEAKLTQDNYQTRFLGPEELSLFTSLNSVLIPGGTLHAHILNSDEYRKLHFFELRHDQIIGTHGLVLSIDTYSTRTNPRFILTPLELYGKSDDGNVVISYPLVRSRKRSISLLGQFDYMNNSSTVLGEQLYTDHIRDASFGFLYNDIAGKGEDTFNFIFDKGITNDNNPGFRSRLGATFDYLKVTGTFSRTQFINDRFSLYGLVTAQYSDSILPAAETFIFGGPYLGRGYDWAQFIGDQGVAGKLEVRMNTAPNYVFLKQVQYYLFYDAGRLTSLIANVESTSGASAGFGARVVVMKHINAEGFFGRPLTTPNATQIILGHSGHAFLGYFQISAYL